MSKKATKKNPSKSPRVLKITAPKFGKCVAAERGHRRCNCGRPDCGANIVTD